MRVIYQKSKMMNSIKDYDLVIIKGIYRLGNMTMEKKGLFWIDNASHARFGMTFLRNIVEDHQKGYEYCGLGSEYTSCGETLHLDFFPN